MIQNEVTAQASDVGFDPAQFDGKWRMARAASTILDPETGEMKQEPILDQWAENRTDGDVITYTIGVQIAENLTVHMGYTVKINDPQWVPYTVVKIDGDPDDPRIAPGDLLKGGMVLGQPIAWIKHVYVDPRTQFRITKNLDGTAQYVLQRRLSEDFQMLYGHVLTPDGRLEIDKHFYRESD
ncbi:hypothetical protein EDD29_4867 [Actinocorallia herbida]|uniref:THAP4-like heme-binding beta-barrel domain-containing protein n=1 Tax=Actinocorallia herbida TaxID=58109 RepID=A0A3N1D187_9ACTN|nr:hypothetical protein [Actinocorallia herbida]ROO87272.1 hypothetical protein EDD29_4867 [Actinocorallia herbida]